MFGRQKELDRPVYMELLERPAVETPDLDVADYASKVFGMYDDKIESVILRCENEFIQNVIDHFGDTRLLMAAGLLSPPRS